MRGLRGRQSQNSKNGGAAWLPPFLRCKDSLRRFAQKISFRVGREIRAIRAVGRSNRLAVLLRGTVPLHVVRILGALMVTPRTVSIHRTFRTGVGRRLWLRGWFLRSKRDQRSRREYCDHQNLFHRMSPPTKIPCVREVTPMRGNVQTTLIGLVSKS
jgi:hypothetical protein